MLLTPPLQTLLCVYFGIVEKVSCFAKRLSGDGCLSSSILFKYEWMVGHLFVPSWAMVRRVALWSVVSELCRLRGGLCYFKKTFKIKYKSIHKYTKILNRSQIISFKILFFLGGPGGVA